MEKVPEFKFSHSAITMLLSYARRYNTIYAILPQDPLLLALWISLASGGNVSENQSKGFP